MSENASFSKTLSEFEDDKDDNLSGSVTVYEDDNDISYYNKSSKSRILNSSLGKRSPLALINKPSTSSSLSSHQQQHPTKTPSKVDEAFVKRLQPKECVADPFQFLSEEILLHIFSYLPKKTLNRIALVNRRFSRVMQDKNLWVRMDLGNKLLRRGAISKILCRGLIILRLAQAKIQNPIFESHFILDGFQSKLQYLDLSMASINKTSLAQLLSTCRSLKKLSVESVPLNVDVCLEIAFNKKLEVLNMAMCEGLDSDSIIILLMNLKQLTALNISWTQLNVECVSAVVEQLTPTIMRLNIAGCRKSLKDRREYQLIINCGNLKPSAYQT